MLQKARRSAARRLPEALLRWIVLARHGELAWQTRLAALARSPFSQLTSTDGYARRLHTARGIRARIVDEFDGHETQGENVARVCAALDAAGVPYVRVPRTRSRGTRVAVSADDAAQAFRALATALSGAEWAIEDIERPAVQRRPSHGARPLARAEESWATRRRGWRIYRWLASNGEQPVAGPQLACDIALWSRIQREGIERADGGTFPVGTHLATFPGQVAVSYLSAETWRTATESSDHWPARAGVRSLFDVTEPIDIVYTWVDGDDPHWRARRAELELDPALAGLNHSATHESRYVSRDELRYSLRSVAMYAGWVRKIFIVTDNQVPPWLETNHPKIEIVDHADIFTDISVLPVFNSHAIESQLHHISGLSEHYLYLNDDVFFGRPVRPELFFHSNGLSKFFLSKATLDLDLPTSQDLPVMSAAKRNRELIEERFGVTVHNKFKHTPHPQLRSLLQKMEAEHPDIFDTVSRSRFRHPDDLSITSALCHYYGYALGTSMPATIRYAYQDIARADTRRRLSNLLRERNYDAFCLNDSESDPDVFDQQSLMLADFLKRYFPIASPFEAGTAGCEGRTANTTSASHE